MRVGTIDGVDDGRTVPGLDDGRLFLLEGEDGPRLADPRTGVKRAWPTKQRKEYALWMCADCCGGHRLWAANEQHLDYLERYINAGLRERDPNWKSKGLSWRLPTWMKDAKHRTEIMHELDRFRASLRST